jgi:hypothetical protein
MRQKLANIDLPPLEPIIYKSINFTYRDIGTFSVKNFKGFGLSRAKVQNVQTEFKDDKVLYNSEFFVPKIILTGVYKGSVALNSFKLNPKGQFNITLKSVTGKLQVKGMTKNLDGKDYLKIETFDLAPVVKEIKFSLTGVFNDPALSEFLK